MSKCECEQCAAPDHPEDCECGSCEALLMVTVWEDVIDQRRVSRLCEARHGVEITSEGWPGCSVMSSDAPPSVGIRVQVQASWTVAHILTVASRFQAAEAMLLAHDASCFCAACLAEPKDATSLLPVKIAGEVFLREGGELIQQNVKKYPKEYI